MKETPTAFPITIFKFRMATGGQNKKLLYVGGLAEEVDEKMLHAAFIPFGDIIGDTHNTHFLSTVSFRHYDTT